MDAMIKNVKELGPYIVIAPGIAMPHARPEDGVKKVCMSLITLSNPVEFGNEENDPTKIVICVGAKDHHTHLKAISELTQLLECSENVSRIKHFKDVKDLLDLVAKI